jgi:CBS domain-containing protein
MFTVRQLMRAAPLTLEPDESLRAAAELLSWAGVSGAPVMSGGRVVGVVSLSDVLGFEVEEPGVPTYRPEMVGHLEEDTLTAPEVLEEPAGRWFVEMWEDSGSDVVSRIDHPEGPEWDSLDAHTVSEVMSRTVIGVAPDATPRQAAELMEEKRVHRVLVLDDDALVGILTTWDIVRAVAAGTLVDRDEAAQSAGGGTMSEEKRTGRRGPTLAALTAEIRALRTEVAALEARVAQLEVREELWQEPEAVGDEPPPS